MAMLAIPVSKDIGRLFEAVDVPGNRKASDHVTMFYFGDDVPIKKLVKIIPVVFEVTSELKPFKVSTNVISSFDKGKHGYPVISKLKSKDLMDLRKDIKKVFDDNKIKYDTKFEEYSPHLTLSYTDEEFKDIKFPKFEWVVNCISLYGGDESDEKLFVNFPFSLGIEKKASYLEELTRWWRDSA